MNLARRIVLGLLEREEMSSVLYGILRRECLSDAHCIKNIWRKYTGAGDECTEATDEGA